jgi:hypothetical protein
MRNLNEYNQEDFEKEFKGTEIYKKIEGEFDLITWDKHFNNFTSFSTPRQRYGSRVCSMASFYYIEKLLENKPEKIVDIGCGWNMFKRYYPQLVGVSPDNPEDSNTSFGDEFDFFDKDYAEFHQNEFDAALSICALNYTPLTNLKSTVESFISIVKPGGRGYIALDIYPMLDREDPDVLDNIFGTDKPTLHEIDDYVRDELSNLACEYIVFDIDSIENADELDGNVRIVFERKA